MDHQALHQVFQEVESLYQGRGIFRGKVVFGNKPALVVVDMAYGWTDPAYPSGSARLDDAVSNIQKLLPLFRAAQLPVVYTTAYFRPGQLDPSVVRNETVSNLRNWDERACEIDARLAPQPDELVIRKDVASAFFGTKLVGHLIEHHIDTVVVTGCSTSACIRATVFDSQSYHFKTIVPRECVQDRAEASHLWNLYDMDGKQGVVVSVSQVVDYLSRFKTAVQ